MTDDELNALVEELRRFDFDQFTNRTADAAASAIRQLMSEREWRPVETAPMETPVLVFDAELGVVIATQFPARDHTDSRTGKLIRHIPAHWLATCGEWEAFTSCEMPIEADPTHWQPLPTPPGQS